ncbi:hypothetical protein GPALN_012153 [Globodera pallida]|nr:hypothetical protein GPALN_012153 [Globodera pallida]
MSVIKKIDKDSVEDYQSGDRLERTSVCGTERFDVCHRESLQCLWTQQNWQKQQQHQQQWVIDELDHRWNDDDYEDREGTSGIW